MKITKIIVACFALLIGANAANAQPQGGFGQMDPEQMVKMRVDGMKEQFKLSDDQCTKLTAIFKAENEEMMKSFQQGGQPDFSAMAKRREAQNAEIKKILTEDQYKQYEEMMNRMMSGMGGPGGQGGPGQGGPGQRGPGQGGPRPTR